MNKVFSSILLLTLLINTGCSSENKINNNFDYYCYLIENQDLRLEDNTKQAISDDEKEEDKKIMILFVTVTIFMMMIN